MKFVFNIEKDSPDDFPWIRILFYSLCFFIIQPLYFFNYATYPEALWNPTGLLLILSAPPTFLIPIIKPLALIWQILAVLCVFNVYFRSLSKVFFLLTLVMFNLAHSYGYQTHTYMPLVLASMAMAFGGKHKIFISQFIFCLVFFSAGLSKIRNGGWDWVFSESMQNILLRSQLIYHDIHLWAGSLNGHSLMATNLNLTKFLAALTILIEISAPLALFHKKFRLPTVGSLFFMQIAIYFLILVNFKAYLTLYIFWLNRDFFVSIRNISTLSFLKSRSRQLDLESRS